MNNRITWGTLASMLLLMSSLAGCAKATNFDGLEPKEVKSEHIDQLSSWIIPPAEVEETRQQFVTRCVAKKGGKYQEASRNLTTETTLSNGLSADDLRNSGYLPPQTEESLTPVFDAKGRQAYSGNPKQGTISVQMMELDSGEIAVDGCLAQSLQYIYGSVEDGLKASFLAPQFVKSLAENVREDEAYQQLETDWSSCMADKNYAGLDSLESASDKAVTLPQAKRQELADTDADCRDSIEFESKLRDIEQTYFEAVYDRVKQFDDEFERIHQTAADNVAKDKDTPQDSSPVILPSPSTTPSE